MRIGTSLIFTTILLRVHVVDFERTCAGFAGPSVTYTASTVVLSSGLPNVAVVQDVGTRDLARKTFNLGRVQTHCLVLTTCRWGITLSGSGVPSTDAVSWLFLHMLLAPAVLVPMKVLDMSFWLFRESAVTRWDFSGYLGSVHMLFHIGRHAFAARYN